MRCVRGPWGLQLTPELILADEGTALTSQAFRTIVADIGASHESTVAGLPQSHGCNARLFWTLTKAIPQPSPGRILPKAMPTRVTGLF